MNSKYGIQRDIIAESNFINETIYPILKIWVAKKGVLSFMTYTFFSFFAYFSFKLIESSYDRLQSYVYLIPISFTTLLFLDVTFVILEKKYFRFELGQEYITIKEGIIKKQERHIPYGVIQDITITQTLWDRVFNIATLSANNATQYASTNQQNIGNNEISASGSYADFILGSNGSNFSLPGQRPQAAENIKKIILEKMKENPDWGLQSGL
jgi:membrane protein YdbS with pleckstrin-like domain